MQKRIDVVMAGAGALYPLYVGALLALEEENYTINSLSGTSGGAIAAAIWSLSDVRHEKDELLKFILETLPSNNNLISYSFKNLFTKWGLFDGQKLEDCLRERFCDTMGEAKVPTYIYASDIKRQKLCQFSSEEHKELLVSKVLRASSSIPFIFTPTEINNELFVDGGWSFHFPSEIYKNKKESEILGLRITKSSGNRTIKGIVDYFQKSLYKTILSVLKDEEIPAYFKIIDFESEYSKLKLDNTTKEEAENIFMEGYEQTKSYINNEKR